MLSPFTEVADVPPEYLRADIARRYSELFAIGWLGRAYLVAPAFVGSLLPTLFCLEPYDESSSCVVRGDGSIDVTLKESSVVSRGIPFRLRLETSDGADGATITAAYLRGIGCDVVSAASGGSSHRADAADAQALCAHINTDRQTKRRVVSAITSAIFRRLTPVAKATRRGEALVGSAPPLPFRPRREMWAVEGSAAKWLQCVRGYWFAAATLQDVRFAASRAAGVTFTFYYDAAEPINSNNRSLNVNPEVVYCSFEEDNDEPVE